MKRVSTPTVIQMEVVECGAASLAIILEHYGKWVPLEELRVACNVSRDGSNARDIAVAARSYGLEAKGFRYDLDEVVKLPVPFIVHWEFSHFLVVEGFGKDCVYLNDPASGPRRVTLEEFSDAFTGLGLTLAPGEAFQASGKRPSILGDIRARLGRSRDGLTMLALVSLMLILPGLAVPAFSKIFIDNVLIQGAEEMLRPLLLAMLVAVLAYALMAWLQEWCLMRIENKLSLTGTAMFLAHLLKLPASFFTQRNAGDLVTRLLSNDAIAQTLGGQVGRNFANFLSVIFFAAVMFSYDVILTLVGIGISVGAALGSIAARRLLRDVSLKLETEGGMLLGIGVMGIRSIDSVKASGGEDQVFSRWAGYHAKSVNSEQRLGRITNVIGILPSMAAALTTAMILGLGSFRIVDGALTVGGLVAFLALMTAFSRPFEGLVQFISELQGVSASLARVNDILNHEVASDFAGPKSGNPAAAQSLAQRGKLSGRVELRDVSFGYAHAGPPLISDLNFTIEPGTRVAIVGSTGSGKSTVGQIAAGLYDPSEGEVLYDDVPLHEIPRGLRSSSVGWVAQDVFLFEGSIYENLTLWDATIPMETVVQAAKDAEIHDVIASRPGGYESRLLEGGRDLSGGEAQRMEIARTLALEPSLLILDEATSALDPMVEQRIDQNIRRRGCSCLVLAHRLSTIRDAEEILVFDKGKLVERGRHAELMDSGGLYRDLVEQ